VETMNPINTIATAVTASMGPRLFRRGNLEYLMGMCGYKRLQWGHVFSDVETQAG